MQSNPAAQSEPAVHVAPSSPVDAGPHVGSTPVAVCVRRHAFCVSPTASVQPLSSRVPESSGLHGVLPSVVLETMRQSGLPRYDRPVLGGGVRSAGVGSPPDSVERSSAANRPAVV